MRKNNGITLIALIITIIILLILVGVSINLAIKGDLFGSAEKAVDGTNAKVEQEQTRVDELMEELNKMNDKEKDEKIIQSIEEGIYLIQELEGNMNEIHSILQRLRELSVQTANSVKAESDRNAIKSEVIQLIKEIDRVSSETNYKNEKLLNGTFARSVGVSELFLKIDNLSADELGLDSSNIDTHFATSEAANAYSKKIDQAILKTANNRAKAGAIQNALEYLLEYYQEVKNIIASNTLNMDKKIAKAGLVEVKNMLDRCVILCGYATESQEYPEDLKSFQIEMEKLIIAIDHIETNAQYNGQKLLDGSYSNISKINSTTLGGGMKLPTDVSTTENVQNTKQKYQEAINMVEKEIEKLGM